MTCDMPFSSRTASARPYARLAANRPVAAMSSSVRTISGRLTRMPMSAITTTMISDWTTSMTTSLQHPAEHDRRAPGGADGDPFEDAVAELVDHAVADDRAPNSAMITSMRRGERE